MSETEAAAIRATLEEQGELSAAVELRRLFPGVDNMAKALQIARVIAGWKPAPTVPAAVLKFSRVKRD